MPQTARFHLRLHIAYRTLWNLSERDALGCFSLIWEDEALHKLININKVSTLS
jgi:hypothetical protein